MEPSTLNEILNAATLIIVALITAGGAFVVARLSGKIEEIHILVNSNLTAALADKKIVVEALSAVSKSHADVAATAAQAAATASAAAAAAQAAAAATIASVSTGLQKPS